MHNKFFAEFSDLYLVLWLSSSFSLTGMSARLILSSHCLLITDVLACLSAKMAYFMSADKPHTAALENCY